MKLSKVKLSILSTLIVFVALFFGVKMLRADTGSNGYGYLWSSNIGWIKLNDCDTPGDTTSCNPSASYGVTALPTAPGTISGYAWSSNVGWITFNDPGCPTTGCIPGAHVAWNTDGSGSIIGWARACSVYISGCSGALNSDAILGSWDGYIALDSTTAGGTGGTWGLTIASDGTVGGYAWGSEVLGWIKSINATFDVNGPTAQLVANPSSIFSGETSQLTVTATNIDGPNSCTIAGVAGLTMAQSGTTWTGNVTVSPSSTTTYTVNCTKGSQTATANATVTVMYVTTPLSCPNGSTCVPYTPPSCTGTNCTPVQPSNSCTSTSGCVLPAGCSAAGPGCTPTPITGATSYCAVSDPQLAWDTDGTECMISEQGGSSTGWLAGSSQAQGGSLGTDGLYYYTLNLPVIGNSSTYTLQCDGGAAPVTIQTTIPACEKDFLLNASPATQPLVASANGTTLTATYTVSVTPEYGFTSPVTLTVASYPQTGADAMPKSTSFSFDTTTLSPDSSGTYGTAQLTVSIPLGDVKTTVTYSPIVIQGVGGGFTRQAEVSTNSTVKVQPVFQEF